MKIFIMNLTTAQTVHDNDRRVNTSWLSCQSDVHKQFPNKAKNTHSLNSVSDHFCWIIWSLRRCNIAVQYSAAWGKMGCLPYWRHLQSRDINIEVRLLKAGCRFLWIQERETNFVVRMGNQIRKSACNNQVSNCLFSCCESITAQELLRRKW